MLTYTNNFKMKLAVIIGIIQMSIGIIMKGLNSIHFRNKLDFFFEFVPQIILLLALFGWMDVLIIAKWLEPKYVDYNFLDIPHGDASSDYNMIHRSPAIINTMIDIFLSPGAHNNIKPNLDMSYNYVVGGQGAISIIMLLLAFIAVPVMLCVKP